MVTNIAISKARVNLGSIVKKVRLNKEYFVLEKDGYPVVGIIDIDEFEDYLELKSKKMQKHIAKSYAEYKAGKAKPAIDLLKSLKTKK